MANPLQARPGRAGVSGCRPTGCGCGFRGREGGLGGMSRVCRPPCGGGSSAAARSWPRASPVCSLHRMTPAFKRAEHRWLNCRLVPGHAPKACHRVRMQDFQFCPAPGCRPLPLLPDNIPRSSRTWFAAISHSVPAARRPEPKCGASCTFRVEPCAQANRFLLCGRAALFTNR